MKSVAPPDTSSPNGTLILVLGGSEHALRGLSEIGQRQGWTLRRCEVLPDALDQMETESPTLVLCDEAWWQELAPRQQQIRGVPMIVFTTLPSEELWLEVMEGGAYDVLQAPFQERDLLHTVNAVQHALGAKAAAS